MALTILPVFFTSLAAFGYLSLLSPTFSLMLGGSAMHLILTPSWIAFSFSFLIWMLLGERLRRIFSSPFALIGLSLLVGTSILVSLSLLHSQQAQINELLFRAVQDPSVRLVEEVLFPIQAQFHIEIALASCLPFIFYGFYLSSVFHTFLKGQTLRVLIAEFLGLIVGMAGVSALLDASGSWTFSMLICVCAAVLGAIIGTARMVHARWWLKSAAGLSLLVAITLGLFPIISRFEATRPNSLAARDFAGAKSVVELSSRWTSYGQVQHFELQPLSQSSRRRQIAALGGGAGHARIVGPESFETAATIVSNLWPSEKTLVLFAGAGADIVGIADKRISPSNRYVGVELNPYIAKLGLEPGFSRFANLVQTRQAELVVSEARVFLESSDGVFDQILFSFAGATVAHYSGAVMHTSQYALTKSALARAWSRLSPSGTLIFMPGSKVNLLLSFKALEREGLVQDLSSSAAILSIRQNLDWKRGWDDQILILKKGGLSAADVSKLTQLDRGGLLTTVLAPGVPTRAEFNYHRRILDESDVGAVLLEIQNKTQLVFQDFTDDRPFVYMTRPQGKYFNLARFSSMIESRSFTELFSSPELFSTGLLVVTLFGFLHASQNFIRHRSETLKRRGRLWAFSTAQLLCWASLFLGFSFTAVQLTVAYRGLLFIGNPTHSLIIGCLGTTGGSLLSVLLSTRYKISHVRLSVISVVAAIFFGAVLYSSGLPPFVSVLFDASSPLRYGVLLFICLIFSTGLGFAFPQLLQAVAIIHPRTLHSVIFLDMLAGAVGVVMGPMIIEDFGINRFSMATSVAAIVGSVLVVATLHRLGSRTEKSTLA